MPRRANGDAKPYKNARTGRWEVFIDLPRQPGEARKRKKVTGGTAAECREKARAVRAELDRVGSLPSGNVTVGQLVSEYLDLNPNGVGDGTLDTYRRTNRLYITPALGTVRAAQLTPRQVTAWQKDMEADGKSASTRRLARALLRSAFRWAEHEGIVTRNVVAVSPGPRGKSKPVQPLDADEVRTVFAATDGYRLHAAVVLMATCGLRAGETFGLKWGDIDFDSSTLTIRRQLQRRAGLGLVLTEPKTDGSARVVGLPAITESALRAHRDVQAQERADLLANPASADDLVFTTVFGTPVDQRNFARELKRLAAEGGIKGVHPHKLRHSTGALLLDAGVRLEAVSDVMGHASIRTTKDVYGKMLDSGRARAAAAMDSALSSD